MGGARGRRAREGTAAVAGRRGEHSAGGFSPRCARLPAEGPRLLLALFSRGRRGTGKRAGSGKTRRLSHAGTAWHRRRQRGGVRERVGGGGLPSAQGAGRERWALAFEIVAQSRRAFGHPASLQGSARRFKAAGCVGSPQREPGDTPSSGLGATAREKAAA